MSYVLILPFPPSFAILFIFSEACNLVNLLCWEGYPERKGKKVKRHTRITHKSTYPVPVEICGIPYMKKVAEFREIPRNFTELYDTEFGGIPPEF
jgi:hypothetical protein